MDFRALGGTGVRVSQLCFGTMSFGGDADEAMSGRMYRACREAGINFFDTADQYNKGRSEEILGELARGHRDELVIATKCFNPTGADVNARGNSRRHITRAIEASLRRLQTDRVEILSGVHEGRIVAEPPASSVRWRIGRKGTLHIDGRRACRGET